MRFYYRRGGKGAAPEGFDRVYTEVDGDGNVLRELLAYVRAGDSVTVEMVGELGGTAGAFVEMALALYQRQATLLCKSPKIDTAAGHWQAVLSDLALLQAGTPEMRRGCLGLWRSCTGASTLWRDGR